MADPRAAVCAAQYARLLARARRMLRGSEQDAEDFVQQTMERFLDTFRHGPPPEPYCSLWLARTFKNLVISHWRKRPVHQRALQDPAMREMAGPQPIKGFDPDASPSAQDHVTREALQAAVKRLSPKLREAYELHMLEMSYEDIARQLRIKPTAVGKRLHDARWRLRAILESELPGRGLQVRRGAGQQELQPELPRHLHRPAEAGHSSLLIALRGQQPGLEAV